MNINENHVSDQWCGEHTRFTDPIVQSSFRVSNNALNAKSGATGCGFSREFKKHGCYSIDTWEGKGHKDRMRQQQQVKVGDVLYMSQSRKNNKVYRGVVESEFKRRGPTDWSFYNQEDVRDAARDALSGFDNASHAPHWRDEEDGREAWLKKSNEYICIVRWSEAVEIDKTSLNEGFIAKSIVTRNSDQAHNLAKQFGASGSIM